MKRPLRLLLIAAAALAASLSLLDAAGWWQWLRTAARMEIDPEGGARGLAGDLLLALPSGAQWTWRLSPRELAGVSRPTLIKALDRLSGLQKRLSAADPEGFKNAARAALLDDLVDDALAELEAALVRDPSSPYLHQLSALVLWQTGLQPQCLEHLAEAAALGASLSSSPVELIPEDQDWVVLEGLKRRLDRYPRDRAKTLISLAMLYRNRGDADAGRRLLEAESGHPEIGMEIARWDLRDDEPERAAKRLEGITGRRTLPASLRARAWAQLAEVRDLSDDPEGAGAAVREAMRLAPGSAAPHIALAALAERRKDYEKALEHLRRAWGVDPTNVGILVRFAHAAERSGHKADAQLALERAVKLQPDDPGLAVRLVDFLLRNGEYMEAVLRLSRFHDRFPTDERILRQAERLQREVRR